MSRRRTPRSAIETTPLLANCIGLAAAVLPLIDKIAPWALAMFAGALAVRLLVNRLHLPLPSIWLKILVLALGLAGIAMTYGSLLGIEPGLGILLILVSLKLLETNTVRDFQVLTLLGWFLCLCGLFFSQELTMWIYIALIGGLLTAGLVRFHRGDGERSFRKSISFAATLLLQATPVILLLFLFFPRMYGSFRFSFSRAIANQTGMSDRMEPGSVASLATNTEPAFRVEFPDGNMPPTSQLYWRGGVLWRGDGLTWVRGNLTRTEPFINRLEGPRIRQRVMLQPHGARWIFALDRPATFEPNMSFEPGGYLQSNKPILFPMRYEVTSRPENHELALLPEQQREALARPSHVSPEVEALVTSWRANARDEGDVLRAALDYFAKNNFVYSLDPGSYGANSLDEFLFRRRSGFCEHYAGAFATLMRIAGIPARVVIGYHGGEFAGSYLIVRQSDAHAWCEVWIHNSGWTRIDPLDAIAPERIQSGMGSFLENRTSDGAGAAGAGGRRSASFQSFMHAMRLAWDNLNYQWNLRVLNFDEETQQAFFAVLGFGIRDWPSALLWSLLAGVTSLAAVAVWLRRPPTRAADALSAEYAQLCRSLARAGVAREDFEGPRDFTERAAASLPAVAEALRKVGGLYIASRYGREKAEADFVHESKTLRRALARAKVRIEPRSPDSHSPARL